MQRWMAHEPPPSAKHIADWTLRVLLALAFISAGGMKLAGVPQFIAMFDQIGLGKWFRLLTGALEVAGALLVLIPRAAISGALILACVMMGAIVVHLAVIGGNPLPALTLLALAASVLWLRRAPIAHIPKRG